MTHRVHSYRVHFSRCVASLCRRRRRVLPVLAGVSFLLCSPVLRADGISSVNVDGRTIFVNDEEPPRRAAITGEITYAPRSLVYWSATEHRWKPVPNANPKAIKAARSAAAEVEDFVSSQPTTTEQPLNSTGSPAAANPNFKNMAKGYSVTTEEVESAIQEAATRHNVDPNLVRAIIKVESNFNPRAVSNRGAMGLMQLMPSTARRLKVRNPFDVHQNVDAGVRHFRSLLENYKGDVRLSLAAYNAGEGAVRSYRGIPPFTETRKYVRTITNLYNGGQLIMFGRPSKPEIKVFRDNQGVLNFTNVE